MSMLSSPELSSAPALDPNAMLLNEFLKEHQAFVEEQRKVQEQGATIARQQEQIDALTAGLQKVSAQLQAGRPGPQVVLNN